MKKVAFILMITTILSKLLGFVRDMVLSYFYGISYIADAYLISQTIPTVIFGFISVGISTGFIPIYTQALKEDGKNIANEFMNNLINIFFIICLILFIVGFLFTKEIVIIFASGFKGEVLDLTIKFTKISLFIMFLNLIVSIFVAFLQINDSYVIPSLRGIPFNLMIIICVYLSRKIDVILLSVGSVLAVLFELLYLYFFVKKKNYNYKLVLKYNDKYIKKLYKLALPAIIGISVNQINMLVDRTIASNLFIGGISVLNYSSRINTLVQGLFVAPIFTVLYPNISKMAADNNFINIKKYISQSMIIVSIFVIPITVGTMMFSTQIVEILFGRGEFTENAIFMTSGAVFFYSIGMIGFGWREIISRGFYSMQDTKTPTINASIAVIVNIILNILLSKFMGINGLALATSISALLSTLLLFINLRKKMGSFYEKKLIFSNIKVLFASIIMGIISKYFYLFISISINKIISFFIAVFAGIIIYFIIIMFMNIEDIEKIKVSIKSKIF